MSDIDEYEYTAQEVADILEVKFPGYQDISAATIAAAVNASEERYDKVSHAKHIAESMSFQFTKCKFLVMPDYEGISLLTINPREIKYKLIAFINI